MKIDGLPAGARLTRRKICLGVAGMVGLAASGAGAEEIISLTWSDLMPLGQIAPPPGLQGLLPHDETALPSSQPASSGLRTDWNGLIVQLSGFVLPLDFEGTGVVAFILVPYVGACVHVPPPPANQLVLVSTKRPYESNKMFEPVTVTGMFGTASTSTQLAEVGYALSADHIEEYRA